MAYFSPQKASEDAISILNRALVQERALSPFEKNRIEKNLDSIKRTGYVVEYNIAAACYCSLIGDIKSLLDSSKYVFCSQHATEEGKAQVLFALNNSIRYEELYNYLPFLDEGFFTDDVSFADAALSAYVINFDFDKVRSLASQLEATVLDTYEIQVTLKLSEALEAFYKKKQENKEIKKYIISTFNWYSDNVLGRARNSLGQSSLNYKFYEDEAIDFMSISIDFREGDLDTLLEFEDELISHIATTDFSSELKSIVNFSLGFKSEESDTRLHDTVEIYD